MATNKKYSKTVTNPKTGRKKTVRYGAKGYKIGPGTKRGDSYYGKVLPWPTQEEHPKAATKTLIHPCVYPARAEWQRVQITEKPMYGTKKKGKGGRKK